jgi:glutathione S-transferase
MKLYCTPTSPYSRVARMAAWEAGLADRMACITVALRDPAEAVLLPVNPAGMVPTLLTDDGRVLAETRIICEHLDTLHSGSALMPRSGPDLLAVREFEGLAAGFLDGIATWSRELRRPQSLQWEFLLMVEEARAARCLDRFEQEIHRAPLNERLTVGPIYLGVTLAYLDARIGHCDWRRGRPRLAAWHEAFSARPSARATAPDGP